MKLDSFSVGQRFFQAEILACGKVVEDSGADQFTSREEAEVDGQIMAEAYDMEWQKRNPDCMEVVVREYEVGSVEENGGLGCCWTVD